MTRNTKGLWVLMVLVACATTGSVWAKDAPLPNSVIEVQVKGNKQIPIGAIKVHIQTRVGTEYKEGTVRQDKQRLLKTGKFVSVRATSTTTNKGIIVTYVVVEKPLVEGLVFVGNKSIKSEELYKELAFRQNDAVDNVKIHEGVKAIEAKYKTEGFPNVRVTFVQDGRNVVYKIAEGPRVTVRKILFRGNTYFWTTKLRFKIEVWRKMWPFVSGYYDQEKVDRDIITLRNLYVAEGFLDAEVLRELEYSADKARVTLTYVIRQNKRYRINKVSFEGSKIFDDKELVKDLKLVKGAYYTTENQEFDTRRLREKYGRLGYIGAVVSPAKRFKVKPGLVDVIYRIRESDQYRVGEVIIRGNNITQDRVIRRQMKVFPEQLFNTVAIEQSKGRLKELGLFDTVEITPQGREPGRRNALVEVTEGRTAEFLIGAGLSSNHGLLGNISFRQRNFDILNWPKSWREFMTAQGWKGAGQTFSVVAQPGVELMRYHVEWFDPMLFDKPYSAGVKAFAFNRNRNDYDEGRIGTVLSLGHRFKNRWYGELATRIEGVRIDDVDTAAAMELHDVEGAHLLAGLKGSLVRDRTDSRWLPSTGDRLRFSAEQVGGDFNFTVFRAAYSRYYTLLTDAQDRKHILAARASVGAIAGDAPIFERFYGGGMGSIRGFDYRGISPRSGAKEDPIGGDFMVFMGAEYSFPVFGRDLRGVVFLDTGTVEKDMNLTTYRSSIGFGIRWIVPLFGPMPMSFDFAIPLSKDPQDDTQVFSFSLGWMF
ncbi:MAG: outer membrane protein assembly factor BamA [bacterium]|nr:outer membrane protein assembly factor BamA [bacterium]